MLQLMLQLISYLKLSCVSLNIFKSYLFNLIYLINWLVLIPDHPLSCFIILLLGLCLITFHQTFSQQYCTSYLIIFHRKCSYFDHAADLALDLALLFWLVLSQYPTLRTQRTQRSHTFLLHCSSFISFNPFHSTPSSWEFNECFPLLSSFSSPFSKIGNASWIFMAPQSSVASSFGAALRLWALSTLQVFCSLDLQKRHQKVKRMNTGQNCRIACTHYTRGHRRMLNNEMALWPFAHVHQLTSVSSSRAGTDDFLFMYIC